MCLNRAFLSISTHNDQFDAQVERNVILLQGSFNKELRSS